MAESNKKQTTFLNKYVKLKYQNKVNNSFKMSPLKKIHTHFTYKVHLVTRLTLYCSQSKSYKRRPLCYNNIMCHTLLDPHNVLDRVDTGW